MNREQVKSATDIEIPADQLNIGNYHSSDMNWGYGGFHGAFEGEEPGTITGYPPNAGNLSIVNNSTGEAQNWGIFGFDGYGGYTTPTSSTWKVKVGGTGSIGAYYDGEGFSDDPGYWIADITGTEWGDNKFKGTLSGRFITQTRIGHPDLIPGTGMNGDLLGVYTETSGSEGTWDALALGTWKAAPVAFTGKTAEETYAYGITGLMGGIHPKVQGSDTITVTLAMGKYSMAPSPTDYWTVIAGGKMSEVTTSGTNITNIDKPIYWLASIGGNYNNSYDGYGGYGGWSDGDINAALSGEYFSSSGRGEITTSSFSGKYYEGIRMWQAENIQITLNQTDDFYVYGYLGHDNDTGGGRIKGIIGSTNPVIFNSWECDEECNWVGFNAMGTASSLETINGKIGGKGTDSYGYPFYYLGSIQNGIGLYGGFLHPFVAGDFEGDMYPEVFYESIGFWKGSGYMYFCPDEQCSDLAYVSEVSTKPYYFDGSKIVQDREMNFLMGGGNSLFSGDPVDVVMIGEYLHTTSDPSLFPTSQRGYIWHTIVTSKNFDLGDDTTYDGGKYKGFLGGTIIPNGDGTDAMEGMFYTLGMIDGYGGYLKGSMTGTGYQEIRMFEMDGTITGIEMGYGGSGSFTFTGTGTEEDPIIIPIRHTAPGTFDTEGGGNIYVNHTVSINDQPVSRYESANIEGITDWGIWQTLTVGTYTAPTANAWSLPLEMNDLENGKIREMEIAGTQWSEGKIAAIPQVVLVNNVMVTQGVHGYWADITTAAPATGIYVGELKGTFNPADTTWQAVAMGPWIETSKFMAMANSEDGRNALSKLNVPCISVGSVNLTFSGIYDTDKTMSVSMNDTKFYAYSSSTPARLWATTGVSGNYTNGSPPPVGTTASLTSSSNASFTNATFTLQQFNAGTTDNKKWLSTVSGTGGFNGSTTFKGAGAGTINTTNSTFSGTAAGIAK
ncbi:MAG: hypothetical protein FJ139_07835 [Deltaproteobacteria bacterium]|nr:hypothetical protein [Deltaproteobacteria bacterium]